MCLKAKLGKESFEADWADKLHLSYSLIHTIVLMYGHVIGSLSKDFCLYITFILPLYYLYFTYFRMLVRSCMKSPWKLSSKIKA